MRYSARRLCLILCALLLLPLFIACGNAQSAGLPLVENGVASFSILLPENAPAQVLYARDLLTAFLQSELGVTPCEPTENCTYRVLLGNTGDEKSKALSKKLEGDCFAMRMMENDLVVVASNDAFLYDAVRALLQNKDWLCLDREAGRMQIYKRLDHIGTGDTTSLRYLFTQETTIPSTATHYTTLKGPEGFTNEQGGCFDGTYYYQAFVKKHSASNEELNAVQIRKFDYKTKELIACSEELPLNHASDITYNPNTGELFVAHNIPNRTRVSVLSADTLQLLRTVEIGDKIYGITYCKWRNVFAVALSSSQDMRVLHADLTPTDGELFRGTDTTAEYIRQSICSDDTFIYHVLWDDAHRNQSNFQNLITVYDWYGNFVGVINIAIGVIEPENISIDENGKLMVVAATGEGAKLFEIIPTQPGK